MNQQQDTELEKLSNLVKIKKNELDKINTEKKRNTEAIKNINLKIIDLKTLVKNKNSLLETHKVIINDIEKKISNYLSLGHKTTNSNILNEVKIEKGYLLAFCLAIGDGIEAEDNKKSPVQWNLLNNIEKLSYQTA